MGQRAWWIRELDDDRVLIGFFGLLETEEGIRSAEAASDILSRPRDLFLDVREMAGYENGARSAWVRALLPVRGNIRSMSLIGGNAIIRMGARVLGLGLGIEVVMMKSIELDDVA